MSEDDFLREAAEEAIASAYANGTHYDAEYLRKNAVKADSGKNPLRVIVVDLALGDSVENLVSTKGSKLYGPQSVQVKFWPDGGIDQRCFDLGEAPEMPRNTMDGRYIRPGGQPGRKPGSYYDKQTFEWDGHHKTAREWWEDPRRDPSISYQVLRDRLKIKKWDVERALTTPIQRRSSR